MATRGLVLVLLLVALVGTTLAARRSAPLKEERKQLAGPPSEFANYAPPNPEVTAQTSSSAWLKVALQPKTESGKTTYFWKESFPVDSDTKFSLSVFSTEFKHLKISLQPPGWSMTLLDDHIFNTDGAKGQKVEHEFGVGMTKMNATTFIFPEPIKGTWVFQIESDIPIQHRDGSSLFLLLDNESPLEVTTNINTFDLQEGQEVGLVARVYDNPQGQGVTDGLTLGLPPLRDVILEADMSVILPDGRDVTIHMKDDGLSYDGEPNDGIYGAVIEGAEVGQYIASTLIRGKLSDGTEFVRNNVHSFEVIAPSATLTGLATAQYESDRDDVLSFFVDIDTLTTDESLKVRAYAEVWGTDETGLEYVPIAWVSAMTNVFQLDGTTKNVIELELNKKWIQLAKAQPPFQLRNVEIQEPNSNIPYSSRAEIYVEMETTHVQSLMSEVDSSIVPVITEEMMKGPRPAYLRKDAPLIHGQDDEPLAGRKTVLVHGYCAGANEFPPSQFTNPAVFQDFEQSKSNDQFALTIRDFISQFSEGSSLIAHSQGGLASLHLRAYYWSPLDSPTDGGRLIQSVGSPYQGTSLAGVLADIGWFFGVGCGRNVDLTREGSANWLSKVPMDARGDVYYYTTQYENYWWILPNDCVTAANAVLAKPNDGTTEERYGQLPGGHNAGHKLSWCHTNGMKYPAQCTDAERNAEMNRLAARN